MEGNKEPAYHFTVKRAIDAMFRNKAYEPRVKDPIDTSVLRRGILALPMSQEGTIVRAAILVMFYGGMRQGEVAPRTVNQKRGICHLTRGDVTITGTKMTLTLKQGKNLQKTGQRRVIVLESAPNPLLCPVTAIARHIQDAPTKATSQPLLVFPDTRTPVPVTFIKKKWDQILINIGEDITGLTLHSLRKAAATKAVEGGCTELEVRRFGGWRSQAHRVYIKTSGEAVNKALISAINK